ncbi:MAG: His/Gly/Thr/Pro-type tRNA ligase C-terminal domain-containing protein [Mycobacteriales bacterium]
MDFHLPARFGLSFHDGPARERPVMVHRSIVSTLERVVAHLLEVHDGALPGWLAPTQAVILPVVTDALGHAGQLRDALRRAALRVELDERDATPSARVRDAQQQRVPYIAVSGRREADEGSVSVRLRTGEQLGAMRLDAFVNLLRRVIGAELPHLVAHSV